MGYATTVPSFNIVITRKNADAAWQGLHGRQSNSGDSLESLMRHQGIFTEWKKNKLHVVGISTDGFNREQYRFLVSIAPWVEHGSYVVFRYEDDGHGFIVYQAGKAEVLGDIRDGMNWKPSGDEPGAHRLEAFPAQDREALFANPEFWKAAAVEIAKDLASIGNAVSQRKSLTEDQAQSLLCRLELARKWLDGRPGGYDRSQLLDNDHARQELIDSIPEIVTAIREKWKVS